VKEYLNPDQGYKLVCCDVGETAIPDNWIEIPDGAEYMTSAHNYFWRNHPIKPLWLQGEWVKNSRETLEDYLHKSGCAVVWQRDKVEKVLFLVWYQGKIVRYE
jgi:hypothetical protein